MIKKPMRSIPLVLLLTSILTSTSSCAQYNDHLEKQGTLPEQIDESSGLAVASESSLWTVNDSGGDAEIYEVSLSGELIRTIELLGVSPLDMEDLSQDKSGNVYIADTGNNDKKRLKLMVYKFNVADIDNNSVKPEVLEFVLPERGLESECHYDFEAMTWSKSRLYLFTKDRCNKKDNKLMLYSIPDEKGKYTAEKLGDFFWDDPENNIKVTAADISLDGKKLVLLSKNGAHFFLGYRKNEFFNGAYRFLPFKKSMKEGVV
ncbi:MAG: hypothetical protein HKO93_00315, partial [Flavobacteriales bacterium]|nr:hypothetical protein [Flavobacteriales bacterium]